MRIEIPDEFVTAIVLEELIESYNTNQNLLNKLKQKRKTTALQEFEKQDMEDMRRARKALKHVIRYYSNAETFENIKRRLTK